MLVSSFSINSLNSRLPVDVSTAQSSVLFGKTQDTFQAKQSCVLLNSQEPILLLPGTSATGAHMEPLFRYIQSQGNNPLYMSYLPEVQYATGIDTPTGTAKTIPAYQAFLRDLSDFRLQLLAQKLPLLLQAQKSNPKLASLFQVRASDENWLLPIIKQHVLEPLQRVPAGWYVGYDKSLQDLVHESTDTVSGESQKLNAQPATDIIDSEFFFRNARREGLETKPCTGLRGKPEHELRKDIALNPRPISPQVVAQFEGYLQAMQQELEAVLLKQMLPGTVQLSSPKRAHQIAQHLMDTVVPRVSIVAHSQGGTTTLTSLLNYLQDRPSFQDMAHQDPTHYKPLAAQGVKEILLLSTPLTGIPDVPAWAHNLLEKIEKQEGENKTRKLLSTATQTSLWKAKAYDKPAVLEMKAGSPLMEKLSNQLHLLNDWDGTVISAFDQKDSYIEPKASQLISADGNQPGNYFNIELQTHTLPPYYSNPQDIVNSIFRQVPGLNHLLQRFAPDKLKQFMTHFYLNSMVGDGSKPSVEQHRALIAQPDETLQGLCDALQQPKSHQQILQPHNSESIRRSILQQQQAFFQQWSKKTPTQAMASLRALMQQEPLFWERLVQNANEDLPFKNSASFTAQQVIDEFLMVLPKVMSHRAVKREYLVELRSLLTTLSQSQVPSIRVPAEKQLKAL